MSVELVVFNNSKTDETAKLECGHTVVEIERGQTKTIIYHGDGTWEIKTYDQS